MSKPVNTRFGCLPGQVSNLSYEMKFLITQSTPDGLRIYNSPLLPRFGKYPDFFKDAKIEFLTGAHAGTTKTILSHDTLSLTYTEPFAIPENELPLVGTECRLYWDVSAIPHEQFSGTQIKGLAVPYHWDDDEILPADGLKDVFPPGINNVDFIGGNFTNVRIPATCQLLPDIDTLPVNICVKHQNCLELWKMKSDGQGGMIPDEPFNKTDFEEMGISTDPADIPAIKMDRPRLLSRTEHLESLLKDIDGAILINGAAIIEDNTATNNLDVKLTAGKILTRNGIFFIDEVYSKDNPMTRHYHDVNGMPTTDTNAEINTTKYDSLQGLKDVDPALYYKHVFVVSHDNKIHWIPPIQGYVTIQEAKDAVIPEIPKSVGLHLKSSAVIMLGNATNFPSIASGQWMDLRPKVAQILDNASSIEEGV